MRRIVTFNWATAESISRFIPTSPDPHHPGRRSREHGTIATALNTMTTIVFSRRMKDATRGSSHLRRELDPREIETMKAGRSA